MYETPEKKSRFCTLHLEEWLSSKVYIYMYIFLCRLELLWNCTHVLGDKLLGIGVGYHLQ